MTTKKGGKLVTFANENDINFWMALVRKISWNFPRLKTEDKIKEHEETVMKFIKDRRALYVKENDKITGVLLFSRKNNIISFLAVHPYVRRKGVASSLVNVALENMDLSKRVEVTTFREDDEKVTLPRALYKKIGFIENE